MSSTPPRKNRKKKRKQIAKPNKKLLRKRIPNPTADDFAKVESMFENHVGRYRTRPITRKKIAKFLVRLRFYSQISTAAKDAALSLDDLNRWRHEIPAFNLAMEKAILGATEDLVGIGHSCARLAESDPRYQTSLIFLLKTKAGLREVNRLEVTGKDGKPIASKSVVKTIAGQDYSAMSDEELRQLAYGRKSANAENADESESGSPE